MHMSSLGIASLAVLPMLAQAPTCDPSNIAASSSPLTKRILSRMTSPSSVCGANLQSRRFPGSAARFVASSAELNR